MERLLHLLSLSSSAGISLNLGALALGLAALAFSLRALLRALAGRSAAGPLAIGGGTYAKAMENIIAFGPVFPGEESREHQADEYIALDNIERLRRIYAQAFQNLLAL